MKKMVCNALKYPLLPIVFIILFLTMPIFFEKIIVYLVDKKLIIKSLESSYIEFYLTILTGFLTLVGFALTIKFESNRKKEDDSITYKPLLMVDGINNSINCFTRDIGLGLGFRSLNSDPDKDKKGDSLWSIANIYNTTVNELKSINNLSTNNLRIGQKLKIK